MNADSISLFEDCVPCHFSYEVAEPQKDIVSEMSVVSSAQLNVVFGLGVTLHYITSHFLLPTETDLCTSMFSDISNGSS